MSVTIDDSSKQAASLVAHKGRARRIWTSIHRWIGLVAGLYLVIAGLTGSVLAFWQDVDEWLNEDMMIVAPPPGEGTMRPVGEIIGAARAVMPAEALTPDGRITIKFPRHRSAAASIGYVMGLPAKSVLDEAMRTKDISKIDRSKIEMRTIFVDPYRAQVTGERLHSLGGNPFTHPFVYFMMSLHCALLWEPFGRFAMALVGLFLLIAVVDGVVLWWPSRGKWRGALTIKKNATSERLVYDLHKVFGVYLGAVLIVSIFSGVYVNFKPPWRALVSFFSPVREMPMHLHSEPAEGHSPLGPDAVVTLVDGLFPDGKLLLMSLPAGDDGVYIVGKHLDHEVNEATTYRRVVIDQYSGKILASQDPRNFGAGERLLEWLFPLHSGEAFGDGGRAFMLGFGFVPLVLYVTGFLRWRRKRLARAKANRKSIAQTPTLR